MSEEEAKEEVKRIMMTVDANESDALDYSGTIFCFENSNISKRIRKCNHFKEKDAFGRKIADGF